MSKETYERLSDDIQERLKALTSFREKHSGKDLFGVLAHEIIIVYSILKQLLEELEKTDTS